MQKLFISTVLMMIFNLNLKAEEFIDSTPLDQEIIQDDSTPIQPSESLETVESRLSQLEKQMQKLVSKIEVLEHHLRMNPSTQSSNATSIVPSKPKTENDLISSDLDATTFKQDDAQTLYAKAQDLLSHGDYDAAEKTLKTLIKNYPKDALVINAKYWLGETYYVQSDYRRASVSFGEAYKSYKIIEKSSDSKDKEAKKLSFAKAPEALVKLAFSLKALGKIEAACATLTQLQAEFPHQAQNVKKMAAKAKQGLNCPKK